MMEFSEHNLMARDVALHYAAKTDDKFAENVLLGKSDISNAEEAKMLTKFFWDMSDLAADDYENDVEILGGADLLYWMEKLMNIFIGYTKRMGFSQQWIDESNRVNGA